VERVSGIGTLRERVAAARVAGHSIALVPTMGNLHGGHLALVDAARARAGFVVVSIFVNPLQFGPEEDFGAYPRTLATDLEALEGRGADLVFTPSVTELYPDGTDLATRVQVTGLSELLCGASRPGHFDGVTTVVAKLLHIVGPELAVFGQKDFQQLTLIRRMVRDLSMAVQILGVPTARAADGLALSSRNGYLTEEERGRAPALQRVLAGTAARVRAGEDPGAAAAVALDALAAEGFEPDYVSVRRQSDLGEPGTEDRALVVLGAARLGRARLIDNVPFEREPAP
jgi:pantoate--beta-alanine ligase